MFTILAIFGFFFTYTLIYKYALSVMLRNEEHPPTVPRSQAKPAVHMGQY